MLSEFIPESGTKRHVPDTFAALALVLCMVDSAYCEERIIVVSDSDLHVVTLLLGIFLPMWNMTQMIK